MNEDNRDPSKLGNPKETAEKHRNEVVNVKPQEETEITDAVSWTHRAAPRSAWAPLLPECPATGSSGCQSATR